MADEHRTTRNELMRRRACDRPASQRKERMAGGQPRTRQHRTRYVAIAIQQFSQRTRTQPAHRLPHAAARRERCDAMCRDARHARHFKHDFAHPNRLAARNIERRMLVGPRLSHRFTRHAHGNIAKRAQMRRQRTTTRQPIFLIHGECRARRKPPSGARGARPKRALCCARHQRASSSAFVRFTKLAGSSSAPPSANKA